jgi:LacI family transcriptional regulator
LPAGQQEERAVKNGKAPSAARPTMRDVGQAAGVSAMTVSRVLSGDARVAPETRARVESAIAVLGYRRDEVARSLRPGRATGLLGLVVPNLAIPFYASFALAVEEALQQRGLTLILGNTGRDLARERQLVQRLLSRRVDGILIEPCSWDYDHLRDGMADTPFVFINHAPSGLSADCVLHDDFAGARMATNDLIDRGHTRIAFAGYTATSFANAQRLRGFQAALRARGLSALPHHILRDAHDPASTEHQMLDMLRRPAQPTALFTVHNWMTVGAVRAMYRVGQHLELAQFGSFDFSDMLGCPLTVVVSDREALVSAAVGSLLDRIDGSDLPPRRIRARAWLERREPIWCAPSTPTPANLERHPQIADPAAGALADR